MNINHDTDSFNLDSVLTTYYQSYQESFDIINNEAPGIEIRQQNIFNKFLGGFRLNELSILCGATGTGKSSLLANWAASLLRDEIPHFVASVENGHNDFINRVISVLSDFDCNDGDKSKSEKIKQIQELYKVYFHTSRSILAKCDNRIKSEDLLRMLSYSVDRGIKVAFLDNLNFFLEVRREVDMILEMDKVIHSIVMFCKYNPIHVVLVMHPKKTVSGRVLSEHDIKGSSTAVQEAHNVFLFNKIPEEECAKYGPKYPYIRELFFAKVRRKGVSVGKRVYFDGSTPLYKEVV